MAVGEMLIKVPFDYEPKRSNRFYATITDVLQTETWLIRKFKRPSLKINKVDIDYMNE